MISRRQGGGDEAYYTYKDSALIYNWYNIVDTLDRLRL